MFRVPVDIRDFRQKRPDWLLDARFLSTPSRRVLEIVLLFGPGGQTPPIELVAFTRARPHAIRGDVPGVDRDATASRQERHDLGRLRHLCE